MASMSSRAIADAVTLEKPIPAEVFVKADAKAAKQLKGLLIRFDDAEFTLKVGKDEQTLGWIDITPASAVALRTRTIDRASGNDWLSLGEFAWNLGAKEQAQTALRNAVKINADLKPRAEKISASTPTPPHRNTEAPASASNVTPPSSETGIVAQPGGNDSGDGKVIKFAPATPEQAKVAIDYARGFAAEATKTTGAKFQEVETEHFLIFTDWDKREFDFLKKNLERAYTVVAKQFDMDPKDNVFVGKLPVYMFAEFQDFSTFAKQTDGFPATNRVAGYFQSDSRGWGHMAMWKPNSTLTGNSSIKDAERLWSYVLVHEFTHAFLSRYKSNVFIPRWLNEGSAEVVALSVIPLGGRYQMARLMALQGADVSQLFNSRTIPAGEYYPVMQTMVELLVQTNKKNFLKMIDAIKDGEDPEEMLKKFYNTDYAGFANEWREYAKRLTKN